MKILPILVTTSVLATSPALLAQSCCGGGTMREGCSMGGTGMASGGHEEHANQAGAPTTTAPHAVFMEPVQAVYDGYIKVQTALSQDSVVSVPAAAATMLKAIKSDSMKMLPPQVAQQVETLSKAKDLSAARAAFKSLSGSLIHYLKDQKAAPGPYHEAYCPMAKASWLQTGTTITNPYMGKAMLRCGQFKS